jgi:hypothetical protein
VPPKAGLDALRQGEIAPRYLARSGCYLVGVLCHVFGSYDAGDEESCLVGYDVFSGRNAGLLT